jgi:hypothetical protein
MTYQEIVVESPLGPLRVVATEEAIVAVALPGERPARALPARDGTGPRSRSWSRATA